ncbi:type VI secretion system tip protein VgrG [Luteibacter yeojuensis]|uniref:Type VI secretion system tip protein VgrG n=1 Tax=Luteibacter yeojuensis TaxID=345309 RepID=A0A7X5QSM9_9GAMM|nr:type VI secretion system tip protein VgrG [Luteibacter yeojuensis]NID14698.1 type VI secretion system tip protein VgrG [Luteibacter yeojuensis]
MADSPNTHAAGPVRLTIETGGQKLASLPVVAVTVRRAINRIPWAEIVISDGDMPTGSFALSDAATLVPGVALTISAGYGNDEGTIFSGIVVRHGLRIDGKASSRLVLECRDAATRMTIGRNNANYLAQKDSDIISGLVAAHGLTASVTATSTTYDELVQFYCSDWDFMLARADANGLLVNVDAGSVNVKPPTTSGAAVLSVGWGTELIAFEADMDARTQYTAVQAVSWDPKQQAIVEGNPASPASLNPQGNLTGSTLAEVASPAKYVLQTSAAQPLAGLTDWAKATQQKAALARIRGRMSFVGSAAAVPDSLIEVKGVGARFSGSVYVTSIEHTLGSGHWTTQVEFGLRPEWHVERDDVAAPLNGGLLPGVSGLQIGVVVKLDGDPMGEQRIQVKIPVMQATTPGIWARPLQFHASSGFGAFFMPEVDDEVLVGYLNGDPSSPVVLGSLYSSSRQPPYTIEAQNNTKAIVTRCLHKIEFNENDKIITVITPGNNQVVLDDKDQSITVLDQHNNSAKLSSAGIALDSQSDIKLTAKGNVTISANGAIDIAATADLKATGMNVTCEAQAAFTGKGSASAELSAAATTTVKGAMVLIN